MAATTAITTAALSNVFISASQCPEGNLLKTGPECKRTRAKARDYIWESTFGMAPGWSGINIRPGPGLVGDQHSAWPRVGRESTFGLARVGRESTFGMAPGWSGSTFGMAPGWSGDQHRHGPGLLGINI